MKKKPSNGSKKAPLVWLELQAQSSKNGIGNERAAALVDATGLSGLDPGSAIGKVATRYAWDYAPGSGKPAAWGSTVVDGRGQALGKGAVGAGGALNLVGTFRAGKIGGKNTVLKGNVNGYVTGSTGIFAAQGLSAGTPFTGILDRDGRRWRIKALS